MQDEYVSSKFLCWTCVFRRNLCYPRNDRGMCCILFLSSCFMSGHKWYSKRIARKIGVASDPDLTVWVWPFRCRTWSTNVYGIPFRILTYGYNACMNAHSVQHPRIGILSSVDSKQKYSQQFDRSNVEIPESYILTPIAGGGSWNGHYQPQGCSCRCC